MAQKKETTTLKLNNQLGLVCWDTNFTKLLLFDWLQIAQVDLLLIANCLLDVVKLWFAREVKWKKLSFFVNQLEYLQIRYWIPFN